MASNAKTLKPEQLSLFATQIGLFLRSGLSLVEGLNLMLEDMHDRRLREGLEAVRKGVEARKPLRDAMEDAGCFPDYMLRMAAVGELSGHLEGMMTALSKYYDREAALRRRVRSAVTYPLLLLVMMTAVVFLLVIRVLPLFDRLLGSLGAEMPGFVRGLMSLGVFIGDNIWIVLGVLVLLAVLWLVFRATAFGRKAIDAFKAGCPGVRSVCRKTVTERFATAMTFLLSSNVDIEISLELSRDILGNRYLASKIERCGALMREGKTIYEALHSADIFPRQFSRMLAIGYKSGEMDSMMARLAEVYEQEVDATLRRVTGAIEPVFVALLSVLVGVIMFSVILPLIEAMSHIG